MEMTGEVRLPAPRDEVWRALNDPAVLKAAIPGCETIEKTSETSFTAKVKAKVGPVSASFSGDVTLSDIDPPNGYTISGEGKGGAAGFAKGGAKVALSEIEGGGTLLKYEVNAAIGGKLAQIGARLIDSTAKKMADEFFTRFAEQVGGVMGADAAPSPVARRDADAHGGTADGGADGGAHGGPYDDGIHPMLWVTGVITVVALVLFTRAVWG